MEGYLALEPERKPRKCWVRAKDEDEALRGAADLLFRKVEELEILKTKRGQFHVGLRFVEVRFGFGLSEDRMSVVVLEVGAESGAQPPSVDTVTRQLSLAGVASGVDEKAIAQFLTQLAQGETDSSIEVARGQKPRAGRRASFESLLDFDAGPVFPSTVIAVERQATQPAAGFTVLGEILDPVEGDSPESLVLGQGCELDPDTGEIKSSCFGMVESRGPGHYSVESALVVDESNQAVFLDVWPKDVFAKPLTVAQYREILSQEGIDEACVDLPLLREAVKAAWDTGRCVPAQKVAQAIFPVAQKAASMQLVGDLDDFRFSDSPVLLCLPEQPAVPGTDLRGVPIEPPDSDLEESFELGEGLEKTADGTSVICVVPGRVRRKAKKLWIQPAVRISPDGLSAFADVPPQGRDSMEMTATEVRTWLEDAGILSDCIDEDSLERAVRLALQKKELIENCMVAVGRPPEDAWDAEFEPVKISGRTGAMPGDVLVRVVQAQPAKAGMSVKGDVLEPSLSDSSMGTKYRVGEGCLMENDSIVASRYGRVVFEKGGVRVKASLSIDDEALEAKIRVFTKRIGGMRFSAEDLMQVLLAEGIDSRCIDSAILEQACLSKKTQEWVVARSIPPVPHRDAQLDLRGSPQGFPVFPGEALGSIRPAEEGMDGVGLKGEVLSPGGRPRSIRVESGSFCAIHESTGEWVSRAYGYAFLEDAGLEKGVQVYTLGIRPAIAVDEARMACSMDIFPENSRGEFTTVEQLVAVLKDSGVVEIGIDREAIGQALAVSGGKIAEGILVASGREPSSGSDWEIEPVHHESNSVVFPGDSIARIVSGSPGHPGWDLEGKVLEVEDANVGVAFHVGVHCRLSDDGREVIALRYGRPAVANLKVHVVPAVRVGSSDFELRMDVFPSRSDGTRITEADLLRELNELGVKDEYVLQNQLSQSLQRAWDSGEVQWHVDVAKGLLPTKGKDGFIEPVGDFSIGGVFPGDVVAKVIAPEEPRPGETVFGKAIPALGTRRPVKPNLDSGCEMRGESDVVATVYGRPFVDGNKIIVQSSVYMAADGMRLAMDLMTKRSNGQENSVEDFEDLLRARGVPPEFIDAEDLEKGLAEAQTRGGMYWDFEVAVGELPIPGEDGEAFLEGSLPGCVFPGDRFAWFRPHRPGKPGKTIDGRTVYPDQEPQKVRLLPGEGTSVSPDGLEAFAQVYGEAHLKGERVSVEAGLEIQEDKMMAFLDIWPARMDGQPIDLEHVRDLLIESGIDESTLDEQAISKGIQKAREENERVLKVPVARGILPEDGVDGVVEWTGGLDNTCVFPGDVIARVRAPVLSKAGTTVLGRKIAPKKGVKEFKLSAKEGVVLDSETQEFRAETYGRVVVFEGRISERSAQGIEASEQIDLAIEPGIRLNESRLICQMDLYPETLGGGEVTVAALQEQLLAFGVSKERLLERSIKAGLRAATRQWSVQSNITVAKGIHPKHGEDGHLNMLLAAAGQAGEQGAFGRIDFREQNAFLEVSQGAVLAAVSLPTQGRDGQTVLGDPVEARDGKEGAVELGVGVELRDGKVHSLRDGVLTVRGNYIDVVELLAIDGDVDYRTGNVRVESGSVRISGSVLPGFEVICPDDVEVGEVVEGARIEAGGNVVVRGGVVAGNESESVICAGGEITVGLARNATLEAKGSVLVQKELLHCEVDTEERLLADRKPGLVSGGKIRARAGAVICQLGSAQWTPTVVRVGGAPERVDELQRLLGGLRRQRTRLNDRLGGQTDAEVLGELADGPERLKLQRLCEQRAELRSEIVILEQELADQTAKWESEPRPIVTIKEALHPRVVLNFPQGQYGAEVQVTRSRFFYNPNERNVDVVDIGAELPAFLNLPAED